MVGKFVSARCVPATIRHVALTSEAPNLGCSQFFFPLMLGDSEKLHSPVCRSRSGGEPLEFKEPGQRRSTVIAGFLFDGTESGPYGALSCIIKNTLKAGNENEPK